MITEENIQEALYPILRADRGYVKDVLDNMRAISPTHVLIVDSVENLLKLIDQQKEELEVLDKTLDQLAEFAEENKVSEDVFPVDQDELAVWVCKECAHNFKASWNKRTCPACKSKRITKVQL